MSWQDVPADSFRVPRIRLLAHISAAALELAVFWAGVVTATPTACYAFKLLEAQLDAFLARQRVKLLGGFACARLRLLVFGQIFEIHVVFLSPLLFSPNRDLYTSGSGAD